MICLICNNKCKDFDESPGWKYKCESNTNIYHVIYYNFNNDASSFHLTLRSNRANVFLLKKNSSIISNQYYYDESICIEEWMPAIINKLSITEIVEYFKNDMVIR